MATAAHLTPPSAMKRLPVVFGVLLFYLAFQLVRYHYLLMTFPYPLEYREGAVLFTTQLLLKGENPYALQNMPTAINVYGINYHLLVYPLAKLFGATFVVHRAVSALFLLLLCFLVFKVLLHDKVGPLYSLSAVLILYAALLFRYTPLARPDSLGLFLFSASIFVAYLMEYSIGSLIISAVLSIMAFYTKPYFVLSIPYLTTYLFLFVSKKKAVFYVSLSFVLLILTAFITNQIFETYFINTFFNHINMASNDLNWLRAQLDLFFVLNSGLIVILTVYACLAVFDKATDVLRQNLSPKIILENIWKRINFFGYDQPFVDISLPLSLYCFICSFVIFYFKLGRHNGNMMTYAYQLMTPFFLWFIYGLFSAPRKNLRSANFINRYNYAWLMPCILLSLCLFYSSAFPVQDPRELFHRQEWQQIEQATRSYQNIMNSPMLVYALLEQNKPVYDAGQTEYFPYGHYSSAWLERWLPSNADISIQWENYTDFIQRALQQQIFDAVMIAPREHTLYLQSLQDNYFMIDSIEVCMSFTDECTQLEIWEPKIINGPDREID